MRTRVRVLLLAVIVAAAGLFTSAAPASASGAPDQGASTQQACDLHVADAVGYSALMLYVAVSLDGCDTPVTEAWVDLRKAPEPEGPYTTVATGGVYSGGAAWFDGGLGCGYYIGGAHWDDQVETTPRPVWHCV